MKKAFTSCCTTALAFGVLATSLPAKSEELSHESRFSIRYGTIEIGRAKFVINYDNKTYALKGTGGTTGLVDWLAPSTGLVESLGSVSAEKLKPQKHFVNVKEQKKKAESVRLAFANEKIVDVQVKSNKKKKVRKAPKYVPIEAKHLSAVLDPASSMIIPVSGADAGNGRKVCNQRFPIFDGETRYDIQLKYKTVRPVKTKGYAGNAYVCQMRYIPVAGHKKTNKQVKEMAQNKRMEIWLAPMNGKSVFTPIQIVVGTKYGSFLAKPTYFGAPS